MGKALPIVTRDGPMKAKNIAKLVAYWQVKSTITMHTS
jgi:hypothetical protein